MKIVSVLGSGPRGRGFKSRYSDQWQKATAKNALTLVGAFFVFLSFVYKAGIDFPHLSSYNEWVSARTCSCRRTKPNRSGGMMPCQPAFVAG